jgi:hypothetical protein
LPPVVGKKARAKGEAKGERGKRNRKGEREKARRGGQEEKAERGSKAEKEERKGGEEERGERDGREGEKREPHPPGRELLQPHARTPSQASHSPTQHAWEAINQGPAAHGAEHALVWGRALRPVGQAGRGGEFWKGRNVRRHA